MRKQKLLIWVAVILIVIGGLGSLLTFKSVFAAEQIKEEKEFDQQDVRRFHVVSDNASVEFIPTEDSTAKVEMTASEKRNNKYTFHTELDDGTLYIELKEKRLFKLFSFDFSFKGPSIKVYVPAKQYESLNIDLINGKMNVRDMQVKHAEVGSTNGAINLSNMETVSTRATSENGKLTINKVSGEISGDVTNGSIHLNVEQIDRMIDLKSVNGKIMIRTDEEPSNVTIDVSVVNGKSEVFGNETKHTVIGDGENRINLETINGKVSIDKQ
ncbi:Putative adhesin [Oceanobacillus limi]|uniref:Putative adhesin n=1 Tax=Oceanobacillus limi TaxID=930131 RepID=A0A1I0B814_9BACI|nr:DUF4097 family beta strand repeat-containing protein [Oceanobacillus limi]SET02857.1 Putative adhesin [Oceanobacillus limi]